MRPGGRYDKGMHADFALIFLWVAIVLMVAKTAGLVERFGQPAVLGELVAGIVLGNLALFGINFFEPIKTNEIFAFLAELGVVILLFQIGLESNIHDMKKVGMRAFGAAVIGVVAPFVLGAYIVGPLVLPGLGSAAYLFLGASLTATSVGITARVFKDLGKLKTGAAQIVLGAAVIDDVLGLVILAVVSALALAGAVSAGLIGWIIVKAAVFLVGAIIAGGVFGSFLGKMLSKIHTGHGMKFTMALAFGLVFAYLAKWIGLEPIIGAFAAGLVLEAVHFKSFENPTLHHVEELIEPIAFLFVPLFFVWVGMKVDITVLGNGRVLMLALAVTAAAFVGKIISGFAAEKKNRWIVGFGMVPRGEVGLIFASVGASLGVISPEVFSIVVVMVILTTLATPPILSALLRKEI